MKMVATDFRQLDFWAFHRLTGSRAHPGTRVANLSSVHAWSVGILLYPDDWVSPQSERQLSTCAIADLSIF